jgi:outer membrane biosynthesis protein TonB
MWRALPLLVGGAAAFALVWVGMQMLGADNVSAPLPPAPSTASVTPGSSADGATTQPADASPAKAASPLAHWDADPATRAEPRTPINDPPPGPEIHREIPEVSERAQRTIRGTVRVAVRVIVNQDGSVFAALTDVPGPSRYFERIAMDAAKKWLFAQSLTEDQRIMIVRFSFTREGTTARAVEL